MGKKHYDFDILADIHAFFFAATPQTFVTEICKVKKLIVLSEMTSVQ